MNQINMRVPEGYCVCERKIRMDVDKANKILQTKKQRKYSKGVRHRQETVVELTGHVLVCPFCGHEIPAYPRFLYPSFDEFFLYERKIDKRVIGEWCSRQLSVFDGQVEELFLIPPISLLQNLNAPNADVNLTVIKKCGK
ncbi:MAG: hypothetical protein IKK24_04865 [Clostridia bacterium]|nr:hypothetical protein [Clostridia bacterium]